jgi:hypothetical protein
MTSTTKRIVGLFVLGALLILMSGIPALKDGDGWKGVLGGIGWFGGCLVVLGAFIYTAVVLVQRRRGPHTA